MGQRWRGLIVAALCAPACASSDSRPPPPTTESPPILSAPATSTRTSLITTRPTVDPYLSTVARASQPIVEVFADPTSSQPTHRLAHPTSTGAPLVFLVVDQGRTGWLRVALPVRPNGSEGWIPALAVALVRHRYHIAVDLRSLRIRVGEGETTLLDEPVGAGTADTPTPGGRYYTKELLRPPDADGPYGPYAYGLSGFSNELTSFAGGEGVIGIHGTNDPGSIGQRVSHGCIRMSNAGITRLAETLPLGVPVRITD